MVSRTSSVGRNHKRLARVTDMTPLWKSWLKEKQEVLKKSPKDIRAPTIDQKQEPNWDQRGRGEQSPPMQSHSEQSIHARGVKGGKYDSKQKDPKIGDPREKAWKSFFAFMSKNY